MAELRNVGGGKSFALLLEPLRHVHNPRFSCVIFRRTSVQIRNPGSLWHESMQIYSLAGGHPREAFLDWVFPSGASIKFSHLEHDNSVHSWQGSQVPFIGFDELCHFSEMQFFYLLSRLRSLSGIAGYIRGTCNPDPDSWVRKFIDWWIGEDGYPRYERSGILRWFIRQDDNIIWDDTKEALIEKYGKEVIPKSVTFIPSNVQDNQILLKKDPAYLSNLHALSRVERLRLLGGNWNVRASAGMMFQREWMQVLDTIPGGWIQQVRAWDRAATRPSESNRDPDWTRGLKMYKYPNNTFLVADLKSIRDTPGQVEKLVINTASHDTTSCPIVGEQDPGSAGVADVENFTRMLAGYDVRIRKPTQNKVTRAKPVSAQCEAGNVFVLRSPWNDEFFQECENFPEGIHDDIVDVLSGAFNELAGGMSVCDVL